MAVYAAHLESDSQFELIVAASRQQTARQRATLTLVDDAAALDQTATEAFITHISVVKPVLAAIGYALIASLATCLAAATNVIGLQACSEQHAQ